MLPANLVVVPSKAPPLVEVLRRPVEPGQYTSIAFAEKIVLEAIAASIGSVGDAYCPYSMQTIDELRCLIGYSREKISVLVDVLEPVLIRSNPST